MINILLISEVDEIFLSEVINGYQVFIPKCRYPSGMVGSQSIFQAVEHAMTNTTSNALIHQLGQELFLMRLTVSALKADLRLEKGSVNNNFNTLAQSLERATQSLQSLAHLGIN